MEEPIVKILFLDLDGTVRETKSGATFINDPYDQKPIAGVEEAIAYQTIRKLEVILGVDFGVNFEKHYF